MKEIEEVLKGFGIPGAAAALFAAIVTASTCLERALSPQAREDITRFLKSTDYARAQRRFPSWTIALFERAFGHRHFSLKCFGLSVAFTLGAFAFLFAFGFLAALHPFWRLFDISNEDIQLQVVGICEVAIWTIITDYLNLLKTRLVLRTLTRRHTGFYIAIPIIGIDICANFLLLSIAFGIVFGLLGGWWRLSDTFLGVLDVLENSWEVAVEVLPTTLSSYNPITALFMGGLLPCVWLRLYLATASIMRLVARFAPLLVYSLDVEEHPVRSIGIVAAALVTIGYMLIALL